MRLIDADALMAEFSKFVRRSNNSDFAPVPTWNDAVSLLGSAPTIEPRCETCEAFNKTRLLIPQPERKKGKWKLCEEKAEESFWVGCRCSECNYWKPMGQWNFCPNCGARMEI